MTQIKKILDKQGNEVFLRTSTKAVVDENGYTAESRLQAMQDEINQSQLEVGAVPSDLTPTENSTNWVTSGGVYNATNTGDANVEIDLSDYAEVNGLIGSSAQWVTSYKGKFIPVAEHQRYKIIGTVYEGGHSYYAFMTSNTVGANGSSVTTFASGWSARAELLSGEVIVVESPYNASYLWIATSGTVQDGMTPQKVEIYNKETVVSKIGKIEGQIDNIEESLLIGPANVEIDLSDYTPVRAFPDHNKWVVTNDNYPYYGIFIPIVQGKYLIRANDYHYSYYAFLTTNTYSQGTSVSYATGSTRTYLGAKNEVVVTTPSDAKYLYITTYTTVERTPEKVEIYNKSTIAEVVDDLQPKLSTKRFQLSLGTLSTATGLYPTNIIYYLGRSHTPKYIKNRGPITIKTLGLVANVLLYTENFTYLGSSSNLVVDTTDGEATVSLPSGAEYFRLGITSQLESIEIEGYWAGDDEVFQPRPSNGYQPFTFEVHPIRCNGSEDNSSLRSQYYITTDSGMLHLPSSYKESGQPTPLIIYIHGSSNNYTSTSTSFPTAVPLAPEWDAAGFAQMDVDLIPDLYNDEQDNTSGGSSDDAECIFAAYKWCIEHFNIRRDGVYLIGRSRGGQAVLQTLGKYNPSVMPVIAAVSNAGAHALINYGIINGSASAFWNLLCESFNLPTEGRPSTSGNNPLIRQDGIYNFLADNLDMWWKKASVGALLMTENKSEHQTANEILQFLHENANTSNEYLNFLKQLKFRSPVPLRFDWCAADTVQTWDDNDGSGNYSSIMKDGFVKNLSGNAVYREWPTVDSTTSSITGASDRGHYHELYNIYDGDYTLPNGAVVTNPSMARIEWLLWCMSHDNRF